MYEIKTFDNQKYNKKGDNFSYGLIPYRQYM